MKKFVAIIVAILLVAPVVIAGNTVTQPKFVKDFIVWFNSSEYHTHHTLLGWGTADFLDSNEIVKIDWVSWMNSDGLIAIDFSKELTPTWTDDLLSVRDSLQRGWNVYFGTLYTTNGESFEMPDKQALQAQIDRFKKFPWCKAMETKEVLSDRTYRR